MVRAVIRLGDHTSHGGQVVSASARMVIDGIPVALWGDHCSCPIDGHDSCVICEGEPGAIVDGRPLALEGHKTSCGATLMASQLDRCYVSPLIPANSDAYRDSMIPAGNGSDAWRDRQPSRTQDALEVVQGIDLKKRRDYVKKGGGAIFPIASNPAVRGEQPIYEIRAFNTVNEHSRYIDAIGFQYRLDPDLLRSIMYMEETHGYYDHLALGHQRTILPMNVHSELWGDFVGTRAQLLVPENNIAAGAKILSGIQSNLAPGDRVVPKLATLYNSLGATEVSEYGARVSAIYQAKPWLAKP